MASSLAELRHGLPQGAGDVLSSSRSNSARAIVMGADSNSPQELGERRNADATEATAPIMEPPVDRFLDDLAAGTRLRPRDAAQATSHDKNPASPTSSTSESPSIAHNAAFAPASVCG